MSTSFDIEFIFDKKDLQSSDKLSKILTWVSDHAFSYDKRVKLKFRENLIKNFNFTHKWEEVSLDFSKGFPTNGRLFEVVFLVEKDKNLIKTLLESNYRADELESMGKAKPGYLTIGYFYLSIWEENNKIELSFRAATFYTGQAFVRSNSGKGLLLDFCKRFNPKEAYTEIEDQKDEVFWPLKRKR